MSTSEVKRATRVAERLREELSNVVRELGDPRILGGDLAARQGDAMILAIDAGNTNLVFALLQDGEIKARWRIATDPRVLRSYVARMFANAFVGPRYRAPRTEETFEHDASNRMRGYTNAATSTA